MEGERERERESVCEREREIERDREIERERLVVVVVSHIMCDIVPVTEVGSSSHTMNPS